MTMSKTAKQLAATLAIGLTLRFVLTKAGWHPPSLEGNRILPALVLWVIFGIYWGIAGLNSAPTENSESRLSTYFHQFLLGVAMLLMILPVPGLNGWFLPPDSLMIIAAGGNRAGGIHAAGVLGANASGTQLERGGPHRGGSSTGPQRPVPDAASSHLHGDAGHVPGNGDRREPVSRAHRIGFIGGGLLAKNAAGGSGPRPNVWR